MGTWQSLVISRAADLIAIPKECMPLECAALSQQLCLGYRLLEDIGRLKVGFAHPLLNLAWGSHASRLRMQLGQQASVLRPFFWLSAAVQDL